MRHLTKRANAVGERLARALDGVAAVWLSLLVLLTTLDVIGRELFGSPIHGTTEILANSVLSILLLQLPRSLLARATLRTTVLYGWLPPRGKRSINAASYTLGSLFFLCIAIGAWANMIQSWAILEVEGSAIVTIPVYPVRTLVVLTALVCSLICVLLTLGSVQQQSDSIE